MSAPRNLSNYLSYLLTKKTLKPSTIKRKVKIVKSLIKHGVEISNPDSVVAFLNTCSWENGTKAIAIDAYRDYLDMLGLTTVELPHFKRTEKLPTYFEMEEFTLEVQVAQLTEELEKVHRWQKLVLKHGSYAEAYLQEVKGGVVRDRKPHFLRKPPPFVKHEELVTVSDIVRYREKLAKQLVQLLNRLMELKLSKSYDTHTSTYATTNREE